MNFKYKIGDKVKIKSLNECKKILDYEPFYLDSFNYKNILVIENTYKYLTITECYKSYNFNCYSI